MKIHLKPLLLATSLSLAALLNSGCGGSCDERDSAETQITSLAQAFEGAFLIGTALNHYQVTGQAADELAVALKHFNSITPENVMKWDTLQPSPGEFNFGPADAIVDLAEAHNLHIVGHTLVWHSQAPDWIFQDENGERISRDALIERMREHIHTVVGRYKGRIHGWDVVNEAIIEDGSYRETLWYEIIGPEYVDLAFQFAHEADPEAELYYNDYTLNFDGKRAATIEMIRGMQERGIPIHGVGTQEHIRVDWPSIEDIERTVVELAELGIPVMITEMDIDVLPPAFAYMGADVNLTAELRDELNPFPDGLPMEVEQALADRYREIFEVYWRHQDKVSRVTIWGVSDRHSWLNNWPIRGRTSYPLLFDRDLQPKAAFDAVLEVPAQAGN